MRKENGITLIALVITIIVLLILAGVTIATLTGDNGLITKTNEIKLTTEAAKEKEKIQLAINSALVNKNNILNEDVLKTEFNNLIGEELEKKGTSYIYVGNFGTKYIITQKGLLLCLENDEQTAQTIDFSSIGVDVIGIKYKDDIESTQKIENWQIFDIDENNIYLISKDIINNPSGSLNLNISETDPMYAAGSSLFVNADSNIYGKLTNIAEKWLSLYTDKVRNNEDGYADCKHISTKYTAYMFNTKVWKLTFIKNLNNNVSDKVEYIMGGPSIEMICDSYNKKNNLNDSNKKVPFVDNANNGYNYRIFGTSSTGLLNQTPYNNGKDYWLSSNGAGGANYSGQALNAEGCYIYPLFCNNEIGYRPIVCLTSNTILETNYSSDGEDIISYTIK